MTPYELFDLMVSIGNRLDVQWGLFITIHMAIFGGIIYVDRPLTRSEKVGALVIYAGFAVTNYLVTMNLFEYFHAANQDIARSSSDACCRDSLLVKQVVARVEGLGYVVTRNVLLVSHFVMAGLVALAIIFDKQVAALTTKASAAEEDS